MGSLKALVIAGAIAFVTTASAHAADLLPPAPSLDVPMDSGPSDFGGWYLRADVGVGSAIGSNLRSSFNGAEPTGASYIESNIDDAALAGVGVGYQYNNWLRFDATGEYRAAQHTSGLESYTGTDSGGNAYTGYDKYEGSIQSSVFLANGYFDLGTWHCLTPYLGAGAGFAYNRVYGLTDTGVGSTSSVGAGNGGLGWAPEKGSLHFAWAAMAGFSYDITKTLKIDVGYRYINMGHARSAGIDCTSSCEIEYKNYKLASNDFRIGLRWMFNTPLAPVYDAPAPLIRKY